MSIWGVNTDREMRMVSGSKAVREVHEFDRFVAISA